MEILQIITDYFALKENYICCKLTLIKNISIPKKLKFKIKFKIINSRRIIISFFRYILFLKWLNKSKKFKRIILIKKDNNENISVSITKLPYLDNKIILSFCKIKNEHILYLNKFKFFESKNYKFNIILKLLLFNFKLIKSENYKKKIISCHHNYPFELETY